MAKTSFANIDKNVTDIPAAPAADEQPQTTALAETASTELANDDWFENGGAPEVDKSQVSIPWLWLAHGVGKGAEQGKRPGSICYNEEALVTPEEGMTAISPAKAINFYVLGSLTRNLPEYVETISNDEFKAGVKPRVFKTEAEARKAGLVTKKDARESGDPSLRSFGPRMSLKILVEAPDANNTTCPIVLSNGKAYAITALSVTKGSYYNCKKLLDHVNTSLMLKKTNYHWMRWKMFSKFEKAPGAKDGSWSLHCQNAGPTDKALLEEITALVSAK